MHNIKEYREGIMIPRKYVDGESILCSKLFKAMIYMPILISVSLCVPRLLYKLIDINPISVTREDTVLN